MVIEVTRSGGFAGLLEKLGSVDTRKLAPEAARHLEGLVSHAGFFNLPAETPAGPAADLYRYEVTIRDAGRSHTVAFSDDSSLAAGPLAQLTRAALQSS